MRVLIFAALCFAFSWQPAAAQAPGPGGAEVWDLSDPNAPRHWFTGLRCWDRAGDAPYHDRFAFMVSGADVACIYEGDNFSVTVYATRRPNDEPISTSIVQTRQQVASRYQGATIVFDAPRALATPAGNLDVAELVLTIDGRDLQQNHAMRGTTGVWHADVGGWTLKIRISAYTPRDPNALRALADELLVRASGDMQTARECAGAGRGAAPNLNIHGDEVVQVQVGVGLLGVTMAEAIPADPAAARVAGYVCLGETLVSRNGRQAVAVMQRPGAQAQATPDPLGVVILALGEVRGGEAMTAIVDMSMNPFAVDGQRTDRGHFAFSRTGANAGFYGALDRGEPRLTAAQVAAYVADGGSALITVTSDGRAN